MACSNSTSLLPRLSEKAKAISSQFPIPHSNDFGLFEATYQPPPPSKNSRVPAARAPSRPLRIQPAGPVPIYSNDPPTLSEVHLESASNSSIPQSLLLQPSPPFTEIPAYAPISPNIPLGWPTLQIGAFGQTLSLISPMSSQSPTNNYPPRTQRVSMSSSPSQSIISSKESSSSGSFSQSDSIQGQPSPTPTVVPESPAPFFYPSAHTRAHPGMRPAPKFKFKTQMRKPTDEADHRARFMGIPFKKSMPVTPTSPLTFEPLSVSAYSPSEGHTISEDMSSLGTRSQDSQLEEYIVAQNQASDLEQKAEKDRRIKSRIGNYPLDPSFGQVSSQFSSGCGLNQAKHSDRQTGELLYRFNPTGSPSFHNYGNTPLAVLDLGCGQR